MLTYLVLALAHFELHLSFCSFNANNPGVVPSYEETEYFSSLRLPCRFLFWFLVSIWIAHTSQISVNKWRSWINVDWILSSPECSVLFSSSVCDAAHSLLRFPGICLHVDCFVKSQLVKTVGSSGSTWRPASRGHRRDEASTRHVCGADVMNLLLRCQHLAPLSHSLCIELSNRAWSSDTAFTGFTQCL